jgi:DNA-binding transcriptional MerR regulator
MKTGRKNAYDQIIEPRLDQIKFWLNEGYSHQQIIKMLGISEATFYKYSTLKSEFKEILRNNKQQLEIKLTDALYKEGWGYSHTETHVEIEEDILIDNGDEKVIKRKKKQKKITKFHRGNVNALIFALCNRFPEKWKRVDKEVIEEIKDRVNLNITDEHIKNAFKALYPAIDEDDYKELEEKAKKEDKENEKNKEK